MRREMGKTAVRGSSVVRRSPGLGVDGVGERGNERVDGRHWFKDPRIFLPRSCTLLLRVLRVGQPGERMLPGVAKY